MRFVQLIFLMAGLAACTSQIDVLPLPARGMVPQHCEPVVWVVDRSCAQRVYHRCAGDPPDRLFVETYFENALGRVDERRNYGIMPWSSAWPGGQWNRTFAEHAHFDDAGELLDGRPITISARYTIVDDLEGSYQLRYAPGSVPMEVDGYELQRFVGGGQLQDELQQSHEFIAELYYFQQAGLFIEGLVSYQGVGGFTVDRTPTRLSLTGPILRRCTPR